MSGFSELFIEATGLLALAAIVGVVVGWSFGALRASRTTTERYEQQMRATLRRMSDAEAEAVTLRGLLEERNSVIAAQKREHESQEHLLAALEARLAEAESAGHDEVVERRPSPTADAAERRRPTLRPTTTTPTPSRPPQEPVEPQPPDPTPAPDEEVTAAAVAHQNGDAGHLDGIEEVVARTAGSDDVPNDDLTRIKGIGKVIEGHLKDLGLTSYRQIANLTETDIDVVEEALDTLRGRIRRDDWMSSAAELHKSTYGVEV